MVGTEDHGFGTIRRSNNETYNIDSETFDFHCANYEKKSWHDQFFVWPKKPIPMDWSLWVHRLSANISFLQACYIDREYNRWQNEDDVSWYEHHNKPHAHLSKKDTGLPPPLNDPIIDISHNLSRRVIRGPYVEAVTAEMWLGKGFWELTGADRDAVKNCDFLKTEEQHWAQRFSGGLGGSAYLLFLVSGSEERRALPGNCKSSTVPANKKAGRTNEV